MARVSVRLDSATIARLEAPGGDLAHAIVGSLRYYLADADSGRGGWPYPKFRREGTGDGGGRTEVDVSFDPDLWRRLVIEADRQGVDADRLLEHAALYYAADLESGRVAERLADEL